MSLGVTTQSNGVTKLCRTLYMSQILTIIILLQYTVQQEILMNSQLISFDKLKFDEKQEITTDFWGAY